LRQIGVGDLVVGKHMGKMVSALGGRLGAYRDALGNDAALRAALLRNMYRGQTPGNDALGAIVHRIEELAGTIGAKTLQQLLAGNL